MNMQFKSERELFEEWFESWKACHPEVAITVIGKDLSWASWMRRATTVVQSAPTIHNSVTLTHLVITDPVAIRETFARDDIVSPDRC